MTPEPPSPPQQARSVATRAALIAAAAEVVATKGYAHTTTRDITRAAGVAEGTLYRHFASKHELFFAAVLERHADVVDALANLPALAGTATVEANVRTMLHDLAGLRTDLGPLEHAVASDPALRAQRDAIVAGALPQLHPSPHALFADYLRAEQDLGRVRADIDPMAVALTLLATLAGIAVLPTSDDTASFDHVFDTAITLLTAGLTAPPD